MNNDPLNCGPNDAENAAWSIGVPVLVAIGSVLGNIAG